MSSICPQCQSALDVYCFNSLYQAEQKLDSSPLALGEGEACCYEHSTRQAHSICSNCGRFLCALCEVQLGQNVLCPDCLNAPKLHRDSLDTQRTKYDSIALALATWPVLGVYFVVITAPLAFVISIYAWRRPTSIVRQGRWRIYAAMGISVLEMAGMAVFLVFVLTQLKGRIR